MLKWQMDRSIIALIKTMKSVYVNDTMKKGQLFFNFPAAYSDSKMMSAQYDKFDSWTTEEAQQIYCYPIVEETSEGIQYGPGQKIADFGIMRAILDANKSTPVCCFRTIKMEDLIQENGTYFYRLGDTADRVKNEFGHDSFVLIFNPLKFLKRLNCITPFFANEVFYGNNNYAFKKFTEDFKLNQSYMFQKDESYSWQKEFRITLSPNDSPNGFSIEIGSIEDIAISGNIDELNDIGIVFNLQ